MKTIGQLLKSTREQKGISLIQVEKNTKIRIKYLQALEKDEYQKLPSGTYAKGFIKNFSKFLNLPVKTSLALFRRDFTENEQGQIVPRSMTRPISQHQLIWSPRTTLIAGILFFSILFTAFIGYQYKGFFQPKLQVTVPSNGEILLGPTITVSGISDPSLVVSVNDQLTIINPDGTFSSNLNLPAGPATITIEATNPRGNTTTVIRKVKIRIENQ